MVKNGMMQSQSFHFKRWFLACFILLSACTVPVPSEKITGETPFDIVESPSAPVVVMTENLPTGTPEQPARNRRVASDIEYNRMAAVGKNGFPGIIPFDGILPIYDPVFVPANEATYHDDELVMGVAFGNEAKAYPVTVLHFREMVNDELAGIPILVSW